MAFNVQDIKSALVGGGARGNLFQVTFTNPVNGQADLKVPLMVRAAEIPAADIGTISVPYFGRTVKYAGDRTYGPWTVAIMNSEISPMQLDWEPNDQIESFQCVFQYDYWQIDNSTTGDAGGI